ncbi:hypothetical protein ACPXCO_10500 [Streptomyces cyaneofuscatus]|uniref:hypothetical protein n=1 Tax=Streptomyces TaxID=1883 RepID=UPI0004CC74D2|nr:MULTISPECIES: hypothetical protein [Streptomyces]ONI55274.1 hypothetical protein STIB_08450 [Streptomyces sp. IB2014 011-1]RDV53750.1 hypothetical protein DDV98_02305 [Streptomyces sp. IB2014 011-12]CAD5952818.1 conserved exported protein of unknown function [Streptomyces sp. KY70]CAD5983282.1 conserved exported protein of unknown function [Streptomyces sp. KY75]
MSVTRRTLLTATAAGTLLAALWFVPSANATVETASRGGITTASGQGAAPAAEEADPAPQLAETGPGVDTTPYLIGGTALLGLGAGFVTYSVRRSGGGGGARPAL